MNYKDVLFKTLKHEDANQVCWVPFAGVHAGFLKGYDCIEVLTDEEKLFESLCEVNKLYRPCGQAVVFDLQLEAEILGCELVWSKNGPPSVKTHPLAESMEIPCRCTIPKKTDGRMPMVLNVTRRLKEKFGKTTGIYSLVCGPFTLASHLRGNDIFLDMYDDEDYVDRLLDYCKDVCLAMADMYIEAGADVVAVVDPLVSQISSDYFERFLNKPYVEIFKHIREKEKFSAFFVCGDATRNIECMCKTAPDCISVDENVNLSDAKVITDKYNICLAGNIPLTTIMLHGTQKDNMKCAIDIIESMGTKNFILSPGCDMPYSTPIENTIGVVQAVYELEQAKKIIENYVALEEDIEVNLPDYDNLEKPLVEVFTLDSATCAACTYMMNAAQKVKEHFGDKVDVVEYKFTIKENIARIKKMGIQHLPSVYINGKLKYSSIIPSVNDFINAVNEG